MIKTLLFIFTFSNFFYLTTMSQNVGINSSGATPATSAMLDVSSSNSGMLVPRVALTAVNSPINAPATSLLVWNTSTTGTYPNVGFHYFDGTNWVQLTTAVTPTVANSWLLPGNAGTTPGVGVGQNYVGTTDSKDLIIATNATERIKINSSGGIKMTGDFENQELTGNVVSLNSPTVSAPTSSTVIDLGLPTLTGYCPSCTPSYGYLSPNTFGNLNVSGHVIDGTVQSITVEGSGVNNSGVLIMGNVVVKTTNSGSVASVGRYIIFLQRSTVPTFLPASTTTIYKVEDNASSAAVANNPVASASTTTLIYPDLALTAGTYYYRLVYSGLSSVSNGQTPSIADRSMVLLQIKR